MAIPPEHSCSELFLRCTEHVYKSAEFCRKELEQRDVCCTHAVIWIIDILKEKMKSLHMYCFAC